MTETLENFLQEVRSGSAQCGGGGYTEGGLVDGARKLDVASIQDVTAECFNRNLFEDGTTWEEAVSLVSRTMKGD